MTFRQLLSTMVAAQDFNNPYKIVLTVMEVNPIDEECHPLCWAIDIKEFNKPEIKAMGLDDKEVIRYWLLECNSDTMFYEVQL